MRKYILFSVIVIVLLLTVNIHASLYAESSACNNTMGKVIDVVDDEFFTIAVCDTAKIYKEFSYCFGVEKGDSVIFNGDPKSCEVVSFTVLRNSVECGVICP